MRGASTCLPCVELAPPGDVAAAVECCTPEGLTKAFRLAAADLVPCEVVGYQRAGGGGDGYEVLGTNGHSGEPASVVPRVALIFDGEDASAFVDRFVAALRARDAAVQQLQYQLCIKGMPAAKKGEVSLSLDKIDRVLQWTFNTDKLKTGSVDTSELLVEVYNDYVWTVNRLIFDHKRLDPEHAAEFAGVQVILVVGLFATLAPAHAPLRSCSSLAPGRFHSYFPDKNRCDMGRSQS